jgi:hypothetical protein
MPVNGKPAYGDAALFGSNPFSTPRGDTERFERDIGKTQPQGAISERRTQMATKKTKKTTKRLKKVKVLKKVLPLGGGKSSGN